MTSVRATRPARPTRPARRASSRFLSLVLAVLTMGAVAYLVMWFADRLARDMTLAGTPIWVVALVVCLGAGAAILVAVTPILALTAAILPERPAGRGTLAPAEAQGQADWDWTRAGAARAENAGTSTALGVELPLLRQSETHPRPEDREDSKDGARP